MKRYIFILICWSCTALYGVTMSANNHLDAMSTTTVAESYFTSKKEATEPAINLNIYPIPVVDVVHITGLEGIHTVKIMDILGQVVISEKSKSTELEFDMSGKPSGMYLIKIEMQGKTIIRKLVKK